jgi:uncharacterized protein (UPF0147 family)
MGQTESAFVPPFSRKYLELTNEAVERSKRELDEYFEGNSVTGGSELAPSGKIFGGNDLVKYDVEVYSKEKEKMIRALMSAILEGLQYKNGKKANNMDTRQLVREMQLLIKQVQKSKGKLANKSNGKSICNSLANAINSKFGQVIDPSLSPNDKCDKVAEFMRTLLSGLNTEFITIAGDAKNVLKNLRTLLEVVDRSYRRQMEIVETAGDSSRIQQSRQVLDAYEMVIKELRRQIQLLANILDSAIGPTRVNLINELQRNKDLQGMVKDIKAEVGTTDFGSKLANLFAGIGSVAYAAQAVKEGIKKLGISVKEYKSADSPAKLRTLVLEKIQNQKPTTQELDALIKAADLIEKYSYDHEEVSKVIGGFEDNEIYSGGIVSDDEDEKEILADIDGKEFTGGANDEYWKRRSLSEAIKKKDKFREKVLKTFELSLRDRFRDIAREANIVSKAIGKEIPVNEKNSMELERFVTAFKRLSTLNRNNLHIALSGYLKDPISKTRREEFIEEYRLLLALMEPLEKGPGGKLVKSLAQAIKAMLKEIDNFSDRMVKPITAIHIEHPKESLEKATHVAEFLGSGANDFDDIADALDKKENSILGGADKDELSNSFVEFDRVKLNMAFNYTTTLLRKNIVDSSKTLEEWGKDYDLLLGEAAGSIINKIKEEFNNLTEAADPNRDLPTTFALDDKLTVAGYVSSVAQIFHDATIPKDTRVNAFKAVSYLWNRQRNAKVKIVEAAQAIDIYLKAFAQAFAKDPDSISDALKMVEQTEMTVKWTTEHPGNILSALFECFPSRIDAADPTFSRPEADRPLRLDSGESKFLHPFTSRGFDHYFAWLDEVPTNRAGNPTLGLNVRAENSHKKVKGLLDAANRSLFSVRALSNILNLFLTVGAKFAGKNPMTETFMSIEEISSAINEYIITSSFTTGFAPKLTGVNYGYNPAIFEGRARINGAAVEFTDNGTRGEFMPPVMNSNRFTLSIADAVMGSMKITRRTDTSFPTTGPLSGVHGLGVVADEKQTELDKVSAVAMASIPYNDNPHVNKWIYSDPSNRSSIRVDIAGWRDFFYDTDILFEMTLKSIINKIIAVVDTQRLFHRPSISRAAHSSLHPVRMIIGGADSVKIIPDALELYMRLPLLAEWYRVMFGLKREGVGRNEVGLARINDGIDEDSLWKLSIVPSIDGVWADFVNFMFDKAKHIDDGNYTEGQSQEIIKLINDVYKKYRSKYRDLTPRMVLTGFIEEMNRSFGFLKAQDIEQYFDNKRKHFEPPDQDEDKDFLSYENYQEQEVFHRGKAPSAKFVTVGDAKSSESIKRRTMNLLEAVENLRKRMDVDIQRVAGVEGELFGESVGFTETLRSYKQELQVASDKDKYGIVLRMLQGTNKFLKMSEDKLIMVHEAISAPLFALHMFSRILVKFNSIMHGLSIANVNKWAGEAATKAANFVSAQSRYESYRTALRRFYPDSLGETELDKFADELHGDFESRRFDLGLRGYLGAIAKNAGDPFPTNNIAYTEMLKTQMTALLDLVNNPNKLVEMKIGSTGKLNVNFVPLKELFQSLLASVKKNIRKLRTEFVKTPDVLARYEDGAREGSIPWIEENIIEKLFKNRDSTGLDIGIGHLQNSIEFCSNPGNVNNRSLYQFFAEQIYWGDSLDSTKIGTLVRNDLQHFPFNVAAVKVPVEFRTNDQKTLLGKVRAGTDKISGKTMGELLSIPLMSGLSLPTYRYAGSVVADNQLSARKVYQDTALSDKRLNHWNFTERAGGLIERFNQIFHRYLNDNLSEIKKFYLPLIEKFVYGPASYEMNQGGALPNVFISNLNNGAEDNAGDTADINRLRFLRHRTSAAIAANSNRALERSNTGGAAGNFQQVQEPVAMPAPDGRSVLWHSSVITMRSIMDATDAKTKKRVFVYESLAEIQGPMKERMCVNLPFYSKLFQEIISRAQHLREILAKTNLKNNLSAALAARGVPENANVDDNILFPEGSLPLQQRTSTNSNDNMQHFSGLLSHLLEMVSAAKRCCDQVYKELQDRPPHFMETRKHFITEYKNTYAVDPILPASNVLLPLGTIFGDESNWNGFDDSTHTGTHDPSDYELLLPQPVSGSAAYQFNSAARLLFGNLGIEPGLNHIPGATAIFNDFSKLVGHRSITKEDYSKTIIDMVKMARFLGDGASHSRLFASSTLPTRPDYTGFVLGNMHPHARETRTRNIYSSICTGYQRFLGKTLSFDSFFHSLRNARSGNNINPAAGAVVPAPLPANRVLSAADTAANLSIYIRWFQDGVVELNNAALAEAKIEGQFDRDPAVNNRLAEEMRFKGIFAPTYQFTRAPHRRLHDVVDLAEGFDQRAKKEEFAQILGVVSETSRFSRPVLRVHNLLDINKPPISMGALMQEVPFINLLNHSYSYDRLVHSILLPNYIQKMMEENVGSLTTESLMIRTEAPINTPREMLVKLMCHPFGQIWESRSGQFGAVRNAGKQYHALIGSLFSGNDSLRLGVPKYLSDQLLNKALLVSAAFVAGNLPESDADGSYRLPGDLPPHPGGPSTVQAQRATQNYAGLPMLFNSAGASFNSADVIRAMNKMPDAVRQWAANIPVNGINVGVNANAARDAVVDTIDTGVVDPNYVVALRRLSRVIYITANPGTMPAANAFDFPAPALNAGQSSEALVRIDGLSAPAITGPPAVGLPYPENVDYKGIEAALAVDFVTPIPANTEGFTIHRFIKLLGVSVAPGVSAAALAGGGGAPGTGPGDVFNGNGLNDLAPAAAAAAAAPVAPPGFHFSNAIGTLRMFENEITQAANNFSTIDAFGGLAGLAYGNAAGATLINRDELIKRNGVYCTPDLIFYNTAQTGMRRTHPDENQAQRDLLHTYVYLLSKIFSRILPGRDAMSIHFRKFIIYVLTKAVSEGSYNNYNGFLNDTFRNGFFSATEFSSGAVRENSFREMIRIAPDNLEELTAIKAAHALFVTTVVRGTNNNIGAVIDSIIHATRLVVSHVIQRLGRRIARIVPSASIQPKQNEIWNITTSHPFATPGLVFYDSKERNNKVPPDSRMKVGDTLYLSDLGYVRFNLKLTRSLVWLVNSMRFLRMILERSLEEVSGPVVKGLPGVSRWVTEYRGNEHYDQDLFVGKNPKYV